MSPVRKALQTRLAETLRQLRAEREWSQETAAEAAGMSPRHYQKIESEEVSATVGTLEKLCEGFGVDVGELF